MERGVLTVEQKIAHLAMTLGHAPVVDRNFGRLHVLPLWQKTGVEVLELPGVGQNGFFLEVSDEAVDGAGADEVGEE